MTTNPRPQVWLTGLVLLLGSLRVVAQSAPAEPIVLRLNGTQALTEIVLPQMAATVPQLHQSIDYKLLSEYEMKMPVAGLGVFVKAWLSDIRFDLPVDSNDVTARFRDALAPRGRLLLDFDFDGARLSFKVHVRTWANSAELAALATVTQQRMMSLDEVFTVSISRLHGSIDLNVARSGNAVRVDAVNAHSVAIGSIAISDSAWLTEIADFVLGFDRLFNVVDASSLNSAMTKAANKVLATQIDFGSLLRQQANAALGALANQQFPQQTLALPQLGLLLYNVALTDLSTTTGAAGTRGSAYTAWNVAVDARPDGAVPELSYQQWLRRGESAGQVAAQGHAQLFIPWTFLDQVAFELVQAGALRAVSVPDPDGTGPLRAFVVHVIPTAVPRVQPDPADTGRVVIAFAARMEDMVVGSVTPSAPLNGVPMPAGPVTGATLDISAVAATAAVKLCARIGVNSSNGVWLAVERVALDRLAGEIRLANYSTSLAPYRPQLENAINARLAPPGLGRVPLAPRIMPLTPTLALRLGSPTPGARYLQLPLSVVPRLPVQSPLLRN
ncbi:MAG: hypothetical protein EPO25_09430 [Gammaproteobacteria bacterium]|nr:MAG: hypothetical protein EPO25_09430 [Gammaproteobacteria bacterium]